MFWCWPLRFSTRTALWGGVGLVPSSQPMPLSVSPSSSHFGQSQPLETWIHVLMAISRASLCQCRGKSRELTNTPKDLVCSLLWTKSWIAVGVSQWTKVLLKPPGSTPMKIIDLHLCSLSGGGWEGTQMGPPTRHLHPMELEDDEVQQTGQPRAGLSPPATARPKHPPQKQFTAVPETICPPKPQVCVTPTKWWVCVILNDFLWLSQVLFH